MNWDSPDKLRIVSARLALIGSPGFIFCGLAHICMDGHMQHPPYSFWHYLSDALWFCCYLAAALIGWKSNLILRRFLCCLLPCLCVSRLVLGSLGGLLLLFELPLCLIATVVSFRSLRRAGVNWSVLSEGEKNRHKKTVKRRLASVLAALLAVFLLCWTGWFVYQLLRVSRVPQITISESSLPFACSLPAVKDACIWLILPNNKRVAIWREQYSAYPEWGGRPYHEPSRIWKKESANSKSSDRIKSYMQMGLDSELTEKMGQKEYSLFVNDYCIAWPTAESTNRNLVMLITIRHARQQELDYLRERYGKWPLFE